MLSINSETVNLNLDIPTVRRVTAYGAERGLRLADAFASMVTVMRTMVYYEAQGMFWATATPGLAVGQDPDIGCRDPKSWNIEEVFRAISDTDKIGESVAYNLIVPSAVLTNLNDLQRELEHINALGSDMFNPKRTTVCAALYLTALSDEIFRPTASGQNVSQRVLGYVPVPTNTVSPIDRVKRNPGCFTRVGIPGLNA